VQCLGAACAITALTVPSWTVAFEGDNIGGLLAEILSPVGTFGKILVVLLAVNLTSNIAATFYSITLNFQILVPRLVVVPRYLLSLAATAVYVHLRTDPKPMKLITPYSQHYSSVSGRGPQILRDSDQLPRSPGILGIHVRSCRPRRALRLQTERFQCV